MAVFYWIYPQVAGRMDPTGFFASASSHVFLDRIMTYLTVALVPTTCIIIDISFKLFSRNRFPTQLQVSLFPLSLRLP
tara:strand:- start:1141 stop:1374 length:234 start_codon:yes stop_codon:yes gene_type:complete